MTVHFKWVGVPESDEGYAIVTAGGKQSPSIQFQRVGDMLALVDLMYDAAECGRQRGLAEVQALLDRRQQASAPRAPKPEPYVPMPSPGRNS